MKKLVIAFVMAAMPLFANAAGGGVELKSAGVDVSDNESLQRGAKIFLNYCLSCHSAQYQRYNRMAADIGISDEELKAEYLPPGAKAGDTMTIAMPQADAKKWFGAPPPDLSVIARARGADWLYSYFTSFYIDEGRPFGVNNAVFADVGMPNVLWELEGMKKAIKDDHGKIIKYEMVTPGSMNKIEFDSAALDLTNFLVYVGEPIQLERKRIGVWVLVFLGILFIFAYLLKKEYWRELH